jgi:hypothetical protein
MLELTAKRPGGACRGAALAILFAIGIKALAPQVRDTGSTLHNLANWTGTGVSGSFLHVMAALNVVRVTKGGAQRCSITARSAACRWRSRS